MFRAEVNGKALQFVTAGVRGGNSVLKDRETGTLWQQATLKAISGPLKGTQLKRYPFLLTTWGAWRKLHPQTLVLKPLPGYAERLAAENKIINQGIFFGGGPAPAGAFGHDNRLPPRTEIFGLEIGSEAKAYPLSALRQVHVVNDVVGGEHVLIVYQPESETTTAFLAQYHNKALRFEAVGSQAQILTDLQTHSRWNAYGLCISGRLEGARLKSLILEPEFWFAWSEFHPRTKLYASPAGRQQAMRIGK